MRSIITLVILVLAMACLPSMTDAQRYGRGGYGYGRGGFGYGGAGFATGLVAGGLIGAAAGAPYGYGYGYPPYGYGYPPYGGYPYVL